MLMIYAAHNISIKSISSNNIKAFLSNFCNTKSAMTGDSGELSMCAEVLFIDSVVKKKVESNINLTALEIQ